MPGSHMLKAIFCLYAAWLLIETRHAGYSRLFPHWCKGCFGHVCTCRVYSGLWQPLPLCTALGCINLEKTALCFLIPVRDAIFLALGRLCQALPAFYRCEQ